MAHEIEGEIGRRRSVEMAAESRETKENGKDKELEAAAAMERADFLIKEVKSSKKQMQNIVAHMQMVVAAIRQLRAQLQLVQTDDDENNPSLAKDKKRIDDLKKRIHEYSDEVERMREDLIREQVELLRAAEPKLTKEELNDRAVKMVEDLIGEIKK
ncbi:MAG: hypothetical protein AAB390_02485 [Patescibacteria group bacterium]